jgi:hypothetical protein
VSDSRATDFTLAIGLVIIGALALGYVFIEPGRLSTRHSLRDYSAYRQLDPKIGTVITLPLQSLTGSARPSNKPVMLIALGDCTSCSINSFDPKMVRVPNGHILIPLLIDAKHGALPAEAKKYATLLYGDPGGAIHKALNACFFPRCYLLDSRGALTWIGSDPGKYPEVD